MQPWRAVCGAQDTGEKGWGGRSLEPPFSTPAFPLSLQSCGHRAAAQAVTAGWAWRPGGCGLPSPEQPLFGESSLPRLPQGWSPS